VSVPHAPFEGKSLHSLNSGFPCPVERRRPGAELVMRSKWTERTGVLPSGGSHRWNDLNKSSMQSLFTGRLAEQGLFALNGNF
jgi:hypothetical protein